MRTINRVQQIIHELSYDFAHFELQHFLDHLRQRRQRDILPIAFVFEPGLSGAWIPAKTADYIFYPDQVPLIYRTHSILHEVGHIVLNHPCRPVTNFLPPETLVLLGGNVTGRLRRSTPSEHDPHEHEAELFVRLVQEQIMRARRYQGLAGESTSIPAFKPFIEGGA